MWMVTKRWPQQRILIIKWVKWPNLWMSVNFFPWPSLLSPNELTNKVATVAGRRLCRGPAAWTWSPWAPQPLLGTQPAAVETDTELPVWHRSKHWSARHNAHIGPHASWERHFVPTGIRHIFYIWTCVPCTQCFHQAIIRDWNTLPTITVTHTTLLLIKDSVAVGPCPEFTGLTVFPTILGHLAWYDSGLWNFGKVAIPCRAKALDSRRLSMLGMWWFVP